MEILIGLTILAVIVRVVIFFCAPELDETLSGFNSPVDRTYDYKSINIEGNRINPNESLDILGSEAKYNPNYSSDIGYRN